MKDFFPGYYKLSESDDQRLWDQATFVFDAGVLLNLFRCSAETVRTFFELLNRFQERIWLTHQSAVEYHENLGRVVSEGKESLKQALAVSGILLDQLRAQQAYLYPDSTILKQAERLNKKIEAACGYGQQLSSFPEHPLQEQIARLFTGKVGPPIAHHKLEEIHLAGEERSYNQIPPCHLPEDQKELAKLISNTILWQQLLDHGAKTGKPLMFIAGEEKEGWFNPNGGCRDKAPHPALLEEFMTGNSVPFWIYTPPQFWGQLAHRFELDIAQNALDEARGLPANHKGASDRDLVEMLHRLLPGCPCGPDRDRVALTAGTEKRRQTPLDPKSAQVGINQSLTRKLNDMLKYYTADESLFKYTANLLKSFSGTQIHSKPYSELLNSEDSDRTDSGPLT